MTDAAGERRRPKVKAHGYRQALEELTRDEGHEPLGIPSVIHLKPRQAKMRPVPGTPSTVTSHN